MEVSGKKALVIGAARSGIASATFLNQKGAIVALHDQKPLENWNQDALALRDAGVGLLPGELPTWLMDQIELVVVSPGVPISGIPIRYMERAGAEVIGEVELASRFLKGRIVGITGSNGKTTTTSLIGEILSDAGFNIQVGGNIGRPLINLVESSSDESWTVAELSSFQLETIRQFKPAVAVVLNVTPNHMDRYESFMDYAAAKHRIFMNQDAGDVAVLNADDEVVSSWASGLRARVIRFSTKQELLEGMFLRGSRDLVWRDGGAGQVIMKRDEMKLRGLHNVENVLAALAAGMACGAQPETMATTVANFNPVEHRLEFVRELDGVKFYNDSKATSVDATLKALEAFRDEPGQVVLILGGRGKHAPYAPLASLIKDKVRRLILIGEDAETIEKELGSFATNERVRDMSAAVERAFAAAESGDTVLLAPACASFDMFDSFEHRGSVFKELVNGLRAKR